MSCEQLSGEQLSGEQLSGEQLSGEQLPGEQLSGEELSGEQLSSEQLSVSNCRGDQMSGEQLSWNRIIKNTLGKWKGKITKSNSEGGGGCLCSKCYVTTGGGSRNVTMRYKGRGGGRKMLNLGVM